MTDKRRTYKSYELACVQTVQNYSSEL